MANVQGCKKKKTERENPWLVLFLPLANSRLLEDSASFYLKRISSKVNFDKKTGHVLKLHNIYTDKLLCCSTLLTSFFWHIYSSLRFCPIIQYVRSCWVHCTIHCTLNIPTKNHRKCSLPVGEAKGGVRKLKEFFFMFVGKKEKGFCLAKESKM